MGLCLTRCEKCGIDVETYEGLHPNSVYHCRVHNMVIEEETQSFCKDCHREHLGSNCRHRWKYYLW